MSSLSIEPVEFAYDDPFGRTWSRLDVSGPVWSVAFGKDDEGPFVIGACADGNVRLWDARTGRRRRRLRGHDGAVLSVAVGLVDGRPMLASAGIDGMIQLWDPAVSEPLRTLRGHVGGVRAVAFGRVGDAPCVASAGADGTVRLWDVGDGSQTLSIEAHAGSALSVAFASVGRLGVLASGGDDAHVRLWDPAGGGELVRLEQLHGGSVRSLAFGETDDRLVLASASDDGTVRLWDPGAGMPLYGLKGHTGTVRAVAFTTVRGIGVLASAGIDGTVRLWDPATGRPYASRSAVARSDLRSIAFANVDGRPVIAASSGNGAAISNLDDQFDVSQLLAPAIDRSAIVTTDAIGVEDAFGRLVLARHLHGVIGQLMEPEGADEQRSVVISVDGRWGSGKSTLARFLVDEMQADPPRTRSAFRRKRSPADREPRQPLPRDPVVIDFDAWRESAVAPHWWAVAAAVNRGVRATRSPLVRIAMTLSGGIGRILRSPAVISALVVAVVAVLALMLVRRSAPSDLNQTLSALQAFLAGATALFAAVAVATRSLFWASPALGRLHLRADDNPLGAVAEMVTTLRRWSPRDGAGRRPIVLVIDELDRCSAATVVAYLETVHTLLREGGHARPARSARRKPAALVVLVLADGRWVRTAFTTQYGDFSDLGSPVRTLGGDFLQKLFDHTVLIPELTARHVERFLLRITNSRAVGSGDEASSTTDPQAADVGPGSGAPDATDTAVGRERAATEARIAAGPGAIRRREVHLLAAYAALLPANPRLIRRIANAWAMLDALLGSIGRDEPDDVVVRAAIAYVAFPSLVDALLDATVPPTVPERLPDASEAVESDDGWLRPDVLAVLARDDGTLVSPAALARCYGKGEATGPRWS